MSREQATRVLIGVVVILLVLWAGGPSGPRLGLAAPTSEVPGTAAGLPPGSAPTDPGPSVVIFPPQSIAIRFNHQFHIEIGAICTDCHRDATKSHAASDRLLPKGTSCDPCHETDHAAAESGALIATVRPGPKPSGECRFCHLGEDPTHPPRSLLPEPNLKFDHAKHSARNIGCTKCHGPIEKTIVAGREHLPRMRSCLTCHHETDSASQGDAKSACLTCHLEQRAAPNLSETTRTGAVRAEGVRVGSSALLGGRMQTVFSSGKLLPPRWLRNAAHTPDFIEKHKWIAGNDSAFCANCHTEDFCVACHDGRARPMRTHPGDYLSMHAADARLGSSKCSSCHAEQSFCLSCHQRIGVALSGPVAFRDSARFHPPKSIWSDPPKTGRHHAFEAERNLSACVSCHIERDCVGCHGARGIGAGFSPHRGGFLGDCARQLSKNPRPCLVCHDFGDAKLSRCR